jgi:hypothetical protein
MVNYAYGKIYAITSGNSIYVGSTAEPTLARRLANHRGGFKAWKKGKGGFSSAYPLIETNDYSISLLELFPCNTRDELTSRERHYIQTMECVNRNIPNRTRQEYYQDKHDLILEKRRAFDQAHKEEKRAYYQAHKQEKSAYYQANKEARKAYAINYYYQKIKIL